MDTSVINVNFVSLSVRNPESLEKVSHLCEKDHKIKHEY